MFCKAVNSKGEKSCNTFQVVENSCFLGEIYNRSPVDGNVKDTVSLYRELETAAGDGSSDSTTKEPTTTEVSSTTTTTNDPPSTGTALSAGRKFRGFQHEFHFYLSGNQLYDSFGHGHGKQGC